MAEIPNGTKVRYHGSLTHYHGEMTVAGVHREYVNTNGEFSSVRYYLQHGPGFSDFLHNVRPESFTVIESDLDKTRHTP